MPLGIQCSDEPLHDGFLTPLAVGGKLLVVALPAEGFRILLMEPLWSKVLPTQGTEEVLWMPRLIQCSHHTLRVRKKGGREGGREGGRREGRREEARGVKGSEKGREGEKEGEKR